MTNTYSAEWFDIFLKSYPQDATLAETAFVERKLPRHLFPAVLDLCCGEARHSAILAAKGYSITGVDRDAASLQRARVAAPGARFHARDMRDLGDLATNFDAVINLWHSFGYFDDETNDAVLRQVHDRLRPGGRAIFDIYNIDHFRHLPLQDESARGGRTIRTIRSWHGNRHRIIIEYDGRRGDEFEWRLYDASEFRNACASVGLISISECAWFDESKPISPEHARMQFVLERSV